MFCPGFFCTLFFLSASIAVTNTFWPFHHNRNHFSLYNSGNNHHHSSGKPTARHRNHCAYVVEKSASYTVQDGAASYVKAEYNKCSWAKKCPALRYRMLYKPLYKVAYKTVTELEWRCCPGFTGVGCTEGHAAYGMKVMPPFRSPMSYQNDPQPAIKGRMSSNKEPMSPFTGPQTTFKGIIPTYNGPSRKGPTPLVKGPMSQHNYNINSWNNQLTPSHSLEGFLGPNVPPHPETSFEPFPDSETYPGQHNSPPNQQESEMMPSHDYIPDGYEPVTDPLPEYQQSVPQLPATGLVRETQAPSGDNKLNHDAEEDSATAERLNRMEEDVQRLSLGLETLHAKVTGLEDHLRSSLREDANRMLSTLLSVSQAPAAGKSQQSTVGFGDLPGGAPSIEGSDVVHFPNIGELAEKVAELRSELLAKSEELTEMRRTVKDHDGVLQRLTDGALNFTVSHQDLEDLVETRLRDAGAGMIGTFERRLESAEKCCKGHLMDVHIQSKKEIMEGQEQLEQVINGSVTALKMELRAELLENEESCCIEVSGVIERLSLLEQSMDGLNQSQVFLRAELGGHKDHVEGMIEGRLAYVESLLSTSENQPQSVDGNSFGILEACLEEKIKNLESRLFAAVEELGNATSPALLEGEAVSTTKMEIESLRKSVEVNVDHIQKQLSSLEHVCTFSCVPQPVLTGYVAPLPTTEEQDKIKHKNLNEEISAQTERLDRLNATLKSLFSHLAEREDENVTVSEVTLLKVKMTSVNDTLCRLTDSFEKMVREVGQANITWQEREERLAQQVKGVVQLVGQQASMLGAGERRLTRLKGELQDLRRRLAMELQSCRSTSLGVQKELYEVGRRVTHVEGQCGGLVQLSEDVELIRGELDKNSDRYSQVNSTIINHSLQLSELRDGLKSCSGPTKATGDDIIPITPLLATQPTTEPPYPRGDQFIVHTQGLHDQELTQVP